MSSPPSEREQGAEGFADRIFNSPVGQIVFAVIGAIVFKNLLAVASRFQIGGWLGPFADFLIVPLELLAFCVGAAFLLATVTITARIAASFGLKDIEAKLTTFAILTVVALSILSPAFRGALVRVWTLVPSVF